jgi:hypothetical protein
MNIEDSEKLQSVTMFKHEAHTEETETETAVL